MSVGICMYVKQGKGEGAGTDHQPPLADVMPATRTSDFFLSFKAIAATVRQVQVQAQQAIQRRSTVHRAEQITRRSRLGAV